MAAQKACSEVALLVAGLVIAFDGGRSLPGANTCSEKGKGYVSTAASWRSLIASRTAGCGTKPGLTRLRDCRVVLHCLMEKSTRFESNLHRHPSIQNRLQ